MSRSRASSSSRSDITKSLRDLGEEARARRQRIDRKYGGQRLTEIGERAPCPQIDAVSDACTGDEQRHVLARVIGAWRRRIVAVIGGHDEEVVRPQLRQDSRQTAIEPLQVCGVALDVVSMA